MKNLIKAITLITFLSFGLISCEGPAGPPGQDGFDGLIGTIYEIGGVSFNAGNLYNYNDIIPEDIEVFDTDVILVYRLISEDETVGEIWEALPTVYFIEGQGILQYSFDFSIDDVSIDLTADFELATLNDPSFTDEQVFRFAVIPSDASTGSFELDSQIISENMNSSNVIKLN